MNRHLHPEVVAELTDRFSPHDRAAAQTLLGSSSAAAHDPVGAARVDLAAIKAANGSLEGLKAAITLAAVDWRDLLVGAGLANADWQQVLARDGFRVPR